MRAGVAVSIVGHAAILGFGFVAFPDARPFTPESIEALPVELVEISEVTDLLAGDKDAEAVSAEKPQPKPEVKAEAPAPDPAEKPAEKPVEAARQAEAPPPPPTELEPAPEPEPEPQELAALPEPAPEPLPAAEPEPVPEPEPPKPVESRVPKARPKPPKAAARPDPPAQPKPEEADRLEELARAEPEPEFNPDDIAAVLNKQEPAGGGDPEPAFEPATIGSIDGNAEAAMTQAWMAALGSKLARCWRPPVGVREAKTLKVTIAFTLLPDGSLAALPTVKSAGFDQLSMVAAETALRAVAECAPYDDIFPPDRYDIWSQSIELDFDPREMFGEG